MCPEEQVSFVSTYVLLHSHVSSSFRTVCQPIYQKICETGYEMLIVEKVCLSLQQRKCRTIEHDRCYKAFRDVITEEYVETECKTSTVTQCKNWVCQKTNVTECNPITKTRTRGSGQYLKCDPGPYEDCRDETVEDCDYVVRDRCKSEPVCKQVPYDDCQEIHTQVPVTKNQRIPFRVCDESDEDIDYSIIMPIHRANEGQDVDNQV